MTTRSIRRQACAMGWGLVAALLSPHALAAGLASVDEMVCDSEEMFSCAAGEACRKETSETLNLPERMSIDLKNKVITSTLPNNEVRETPIKGMDRQEDRLTLGGAEAALSWLLVTDASGGMTLSAVATRRGEQFAAIAFGTCRPE